MLFQTQQIVYRGTEMPAHNAPLYSESELKALRTDSRLLKPNAVVDRNNREFKLYYNIQRLNSTHASYFLRPIAIFDMKEKQFASAVVLPKLDGTYTHPYLAPCTLHSPASPCTCSLALRCVALVCCCVAGTVYDLISQTDHIFTEQQAFWLLDFMFRTCTAVCCAVCLLYLFVVWEC